MTATPYVSLYDQRVAMVQRVIEQNSKLRTERAKAIAVLVLDAIDHIPEKIR
jgi:hypothetical protein